LPVKCNIVPSEPTYLLSDEFEDLPDVNDAASEEVQGSLPSLVLCVPPHDLVSYCVQLSQLVDIHLEEGG